MSRPSLLDLENHAEFIQRHIGPTVEQQTAMARAIGYDNLDALIDDTVPATIRRQQPMQLPGAQTEQQVIARLRELASLNIVNRSFIGMGYHDTVTPPVIQRNVLENPGWYTAYTPYQPEISQGRLEALLTFQQMVLDLTGMDLANASMLDEGTAAAEAMTLLQRVNKKNRSSTFLIADDCHPQTIAVVKTRAKALDIEVLVGDPAELLNATEAFGLLVQYPGTYGHLQDISPLTEKAHAKNTLVAVAADIMALLLVKSPGSMGADVVLGNTQRFGVPMGFGGPHAAFFATRDAYKRSTPGRIIGVSIDRRGNQALRMAMQTREQHIRREKATSNICTAQALLAVMAAFYAMYHGPTGLRRIATRIQRLACILVKGLEDAGFTRDNASFFDTISYTVGGQQQAIVERALAGGLNLRII
ncbi:MAG: glycine dehydrogenase, partial [Halioglobus sp.]|nr:glycine dehydrogenase [Halioglobus sp.]